MDAGVQEPVQTPRGRVLVCGSSHGVLAHGLGTRLCAGCVAREGMHRLVLETPLQLPQQLRGHGNSCRRAGGVRGRREQTDQGWTDVSDEGGAQGKKLLATLPT